MRTVYQVLSNHPYEGGYSIDDIEKAMKEYAQEAIDQLLKEHDEWLSADSEEDAVWGPIIRIDRDWVNKYKQLLG